MWVSLAAEGIDMKHPKPGPKRTRWLTTGLLIVCLPLIMGQIEDCLPDPTPKSNTRPLALDCVSDGTQIFMPLDITATADRPIEALRGGVFIDSTATMRIPAAMFCAMQNAGATQTDIESGALGINFDGVREPGDFFTLHTAVNVPIQNIDIVAACADTNDILVDFGIAQAVPWTSDGWTIDLTIGQPPAFLVLLKNIDLPGLPVPGPTVDLLTLCDPTDKSVPPNGTTDDPEDSPRIAADRDNDGVYESLATAEDQIRFNVQGYCAGDRCNDYNDCTIDTCDPRFITPLSCTWDNQPDGISCDLAGLPGVCSAGTCVPPTGSDPCDLDPSNCTKLITLGCTNNVTQDVTMQYFELTVTPDPLVAGTVVPLTYGGTVVFPEFFLDAVQGGVPGGVDSGNLIDAQATVHVRSGATASDVTLAAPVSSLPATCFFDQATCDPANDLASIPGLRGNTDCVPVVNVNACQHVVAFPTSSDCAQGGTCDSLGKSVQCSSNGFCITGPLVFQLADVGTTITPDASGQVLFGWDDQSTGAAVNPDGTWNLPLADFTAPTGPNGIRMNAQGLAVALRCTMGVDAGGQLGPFPPVPNQSSPTPDSELINFSIQAP